jgi:hypothetical protein
MVGCTQRCGQTRTLSPWAARLDQREVP